MNSGKVLVSVLAGVAAGALLGVLYAPKKGSDTRKKISKKGEDYVDVIKEKFDEFIESLSEKYDKVKEEVEVEVKEQLLALDCMAQNSEAVE